MQLIDHASAVRFIHAMLAFFSSEHCLSQQLAAYFGDTEAPLQCGHCSVCHGQVAHLPQLKPLPALTGQNFQALCGELLARQQMPGARPVSAETLTRFLCGVTAPLLTQLKARGLPGFAALENYPYADVRQWVAQQLARLDPGPSPTD